jgi:hypothetical protein
VHRSLDGEAQLRQHPHLQARGAGFYTDLDVVIAAGPERWTADVAGPTGLTVTDFRLEWESQDPVRCSVTLSLQREQVELTIGLSRWMGDKANARRIDMGAPGKECMGAGIQTDAKFTPDKGGLAPPRPELVAVTGAYQLLPPGPRRGAALPRRQDFDHRDSPRRALIARLLLRFERCRPGQAP